MNFHPFNVWLFEVGREVRRESGLRSAFYAGLTAQGWPYCPGVGRLTQAFRLPGGWVWWKAKDGVAYWMWQPLKPGE